MTIQTVMDSVKSFMEPRARQKSLSWYQDNALTILKFEYPTAYGLLRACQALYGDDFLYYEPETVWLLLERSGVELNNDNRDKIMAAIAVLLDTSYFYDARAFTALCIGLNDDELTPDAMVPIDPPMMCWAVIEAQAILGDAQKRLEIRTIPSVDYEVKQVVAVNLNYFGYVLAPPMLDWSQKALNHQTRNFESLDGLRALVEQYDLNSDDPDDDDDEVTIQIKRQLRCYAYLEDRLEQAAKEEALIPR